MDAEQLWHAPLPEQCPPGVAVAPDGVYFRLVDQRQPGATAKPRDFKVQRKHLQPSADDPPPSNEQDCSRRALSIDSDLVNLWKAYCAVPYRPSGSQKAPAKGTLVPEDGLVHPDGVGSPTHVNFWAKADRLSAVAESFIVVSPPDVCTKGGE